MRKSAIVICVALIVAIVISSGCTSLESPSVATPSFSPTSTSSPTPAPTPVPTKNTQPENDIKFLSEASKYNDEMAIANKIFSNAVLEQNQWVSNVELSEQNYQNALEFLEEEQAISDSITNRYTSNMQSVGSNVARARSLTIQYNQDIAEVSTYVATAQNEVDAKNAARTEAKKPLDLKAKGLDITVLNTTCSKILDQLTPLPVSSDLQPTKDQYLTAISSFKKSGDTFVTAVNYYNNGQISEGSNALKQSSTYLDAGNNQLNTCSLTIQQYKNKIGI